MKRRLGILLLICLGIGAISISQPKGQARLPDAPTATVVSPTETIIERVPTSVVLIEPKPPVKMGDAGQPAVLPTSVPEVVASPTSLWNPPGSVVAPILLYHHVAETVQRTRYVTSPASFESQIRRLNAWGYTPVRLSLLVQALMTGAQLPERPVVITFDDGYMDVYQNAYPILQHYGFTATVFMIVNQINSKGYLHAEQLKELLAQGWEVGSHSRSHISLNKPGVDLVSEIVTSRQELENWLGVSVLSFSFPYGLTNTEANRLVQQAGYQSAVGLGGSYRHTLKTRFYLSRIEVRGDTGESSFADLLPWSGQLTQPDPIHPGEQ